MPDVHVESSLYSEAVRERVGGVLKRLARTGALPTLPAVARAALDVAEHPAADLVELCAVLQLDVGLAARVLRIANTGPAGRRRPVRRLEDALVAAGLRKTCDVLRAAGARQLEDAAGPRAEILWKHALATAEASAELARRSGLVEPECAFVTGLLHDVGRIAFLLADEVSLEVVDHLAEARGVERTGMEHEWYGFDHAEAGASLCSDWGITPEQCDAIRWHHAPDAAGPSQDLARLVGAADWIAYEMGCGGSARRPAIAGATLERFGIDGEGREPLVKQLLVGFSRHRGLLG